MGVSPRGGIGPEELHQLQTVDVRHDQVLQDHCRLQLVGHRDRLGGILAKVEADVGLGRQHPADGFPDNGLVIDQQDR